MQNESIKNVDQEHDSFRFAHLSDLHISSLGIPAPWQILNKRILGYLSWLKKRRKTHKLAIANLAISQLKKSSVDHYVVTGDLTHIGLQNEFKQTRDWLTSIGTGSEVSVIPGNHDLYVKETWSRSFQHWQAYLQGDDTEYCLASSSEDALARLDNLYPLLRIRGNTAFICLSSVFNAPWFRATGRINKDQLDRFSQLLTSPKLNNFCKVVLIHHPITLTNTSKRKSLLNYQNVLDVIHNSNIQLVLHGHGHQSTHEFVKSKTDNKTLVVGASSSSSTSQKEGHKAEFLIFDVQSTTKNWNIQMQSFLLDNQIQKFQKASQQSFSFVKSA